MKAIEKRKERAVVYARHRGYGNVCDISIECQVSRCTEYAMANGYTIVNTYADVDLGTSHYRPEFERMINDSKDREFDTVLVFSADRISRNLTQFLKIKAMLKENGVSLVIVPYETDNYFLSGLDLSYITIKLPVDIRGETRYSKVKNDRRYKI